MAINRSVALAKALLVVSIILAPVISGAQQTGKPQSSLKEILKKPKQGLIDQLIHTTARIETIDKSGKPHFGTGFFFRFLEKSNATHIPTIVTNKHVVKDAVKGAFHITVCTKDGGPSYSEHVRIEFGNFEKMWLKHDSADLAIMPIAPIVQRARRIGKRLFYRSVAKELIPTTKQMEGLGALQEILMVGYPIGLWDSVHNLPIIRSGITATHPKVNYNGKEIFLIDAACFPGSSGSPVFLFDRGVRAKKGALFFGSPRVNLLGVLYATPTYTPEGKIEIVEIPTRMELRPKIGVPINIGAVIKAKKLLDFETLLRELHVSGAVFGVKP